MLSAGTKEDNSVIEKFSVGLVGLLDEQYSGWCSG